MKSPSYPKEPLLVALANSRRGKTLVIGMTLKDVGELLVGENVLEADVEATNFMLGRVCIVAGKNIDDVKKTLRRNGVRLAEQRGSASSPPPPR